MLQKIRTHVSKIQLGQRGASSVEYLIVVGLIAFAVYAGFKAFGTTMATKITSATTQVSNMSF